MESEADHILQLSLYVGNVLGIIIWCSQAWIAFHAISFLLPNQEIRPSSKRYLAVCAITLIACTGLGVGVSVALGQSAWIEDRDWLGGFAANFERKGMKWWPALGVGSALFANSLADVLLLYRCYVIWDSNLCIVAFPMLLLFAASAMGVVALIFASGPGLIFSHELRLKYGIPWIVLSSVFNLILTVLVVGRLLYLRRQVRKAIHVQYAEVYSSLPVIFIESAMPLTVLQIVQVVAMTMRSPAKILFGPIWCAYVGVTPMLVILLVAMNRTWNRRAIEDMQVCIAKTIQRDNHLEAPRCWQRGRFLANHPHVGSSSFKLSRNPSMSSDATGNIKAGEVNSLG